MTQRGYANTPEGQLHYAVDGAGPPLILLHPGPRSSRIYWRLMPLLAPHFRCFALDTLGFGNSDAAPPGVRFEQLAQSVVHAMDALGLAKAHFFGVHTGNKIATAVGADWPERVDRLILSGMPHSLIVDQARRNAAIHSFVANFVKFDSSLGEPELMREWSSAFVSIAKIWWNDLVLGQRQIGMGRFRILEQRLVDLIQARGSMFESVRANFAYDLVEGMRRLTGPTLLIELATPEEEHFGRQGPALVKMLKHGRLVTIENAGQEIVEEGAERLAPIMIEFLRGPLEGSSHH